jgi:hypothetical protein
LASLVKETSRQASPRKVAALSHVFQHVDLPLFQKQGNTLHRILLQAVLSIPLYTYACIEKLCIENEALISDLRSFTRSHEIIDCGDAWERFRAKEANVDGGTDACGKRRNYNRVKTDAFPWALRPGWDQTAEETKWSLRGPVTGRALGC